ncbi:ycf2 protein [Tanacetum coccineum]
MVNDDDEIKVLAEINVELESHTHKPIKKLSKEKDSQEEDLGEFNSILASSKLQTEFKKVKSLIIPSSMIELRKLLD